MQYPLLLEGDNFKSPEILFDNATGIFEIKGMSSIENPRSIYTKILEWLDLYCLEPVPKTTLNVKLTYFNTTSAKYILDILEKIVRLTKTDFIVEINWYCEEEDEDMIDAAINFESIIKHDVHIHYVQPEEDE